MLLASLLIVLTQLMGLVRSDDPDAPISLYDLSTDIYELTDLSKKNEYTDTLAAFRSQATELAAKYYVDPIYANYDALQDSWTVNGGVGPWMTTDAVPRTITQKYTTTVTTSTSTGTSTDTDSTESTQPPHIVFVLVDDWGWNDVGMRSTYLSWATPNVDRIAKEGISLENYYTNELCTPSRGSLLTSKYAWRLGFESTVDVHGTHAELSLDEVTLAEEMKSAGYRTYIIGKWDMGISTTNHMPIQRGFDYFYGFLGGFEDYYFKTYGSDQDLRENNDLVTDAEELHPDLHSAYLFETKAEAAIEAHATNYPDTPMFMYYAMQLIHAPYEVPDVYRDRCEDPSLVVTDADTASDHQTYCGMILMMDEAIANLTCALNKNGMSDNTVMVIASDNGGLDSMPSSSVPWRGSKGSHAKGGVMATAIVHSGNTKYVPEAMQGKVYNGLMHVTDWMPTLMHLATNGEWDGSYVSGTELDGINMWDSLTSGTNKSPRTEIVHVIGDADASLAVITTNQFKYVYGEALPVANAVDFVFSADQDKKSSSVSCSAPYLTADSVEFFESTPRTSLLSSLVGVDAKTEHSTAAVFIRVSAIAAVCILTVVTFVIFGLPQSWKKNQYMPIDRQEAVESCEIE
jgi:arylsulfatase B